MSPSSSQPVKYRFSFGPWNISEGADPFGPETRKPIAFTFFAPLLLSLCATIHAAEPAFPR